MTITAQVAVTSADHPIQRIGGRTLLQNRFISVVTDDVVFPNGSPGSCSVITTGTGMGVIAIPFANFHGQPYLGMVKQYRQDCVAHDAAGGRQAEAPGEFPDGHRGDDDGGCVQREERQEFVHSV
jgi:hypothetical protein